MNVIPKTITQSSVSFDFVQTTEGVYQPTDPSFSDCRLVSLHSFDFGGKKPKRQCNVIYIDEDKIEIAITSIWKDKQFIIVNEEMTVHFKVNA